jgi:predicted nuclease with TOPRIM domain
MIDNNRRFDDVFCAIRDMSKRIAALENGRDDKSEPESLPSGHGLFDRCQITDKLIFNKQREIKELKQTVNQQAASINNLYTKNKELENDKKYWVERSEKMQHAYSDLRWRWDNQPVVEKQTARACTEIVNRIKNDPLTTVFRDANSKQWMAAICEDIEKAIKKEFDLR